MRCGTSFALLALPLASAYQLAAGCASRGVSVARASSQMQMVPGENKVIDSQDTYNVMMRVLLETNSSVADQISASYHMVDYAFLQKLDQRAESETDEKVSARASTVKMPWLAAAHAATHRSRSPLACARQPFVGPGGAPSPLGCRSEAAAALWCPPNVADPAAWLSFWLSFGSPLATQARVTEIKDAVNNEMRTRIEAATVTFKDIVQSPSAIIMEGKIAGLSRQGKVRTKRGDDEPSP